VLSSDKPEPFTDDSPHKKGRGGNQVENLTDCFHESSNCDYDFFHS